MQATAFGRAVITALSLSLVLGACVGTQRHGQDMAGRIWSERAGAFVDDAEVMDAVANARFVLLGETHDIPAHHAAQARLIRAAAADRKPAIVLEMVRRDQQPEIERWRREDGNPGSFGAAVEWESRGWPEWSMYQPIIEAAVDLDLPIVAAAPPVDVRREVGRNGLVSLASVRRRELWLDRPLPDAGQTRLETTLRTAHCGIGDTGMVDAMVRVQRLRDAYLAETMRKAALAYGATILVAGRGHTRTDHGVPLYLPAAGMNSPIVTIGFAGTGEFSDVAALRDSGGGVIAHDYAWFTAGGRPAPGCDSG